MDIDKKVAKSRCIRLVGMLTAHSEDAIYDALEVATLSECGENLIAAIRRIAREIEAEEREAAEEMRGEAIMEDWRGN